MGRFEALPGQCLGGLRGRYWKAMRGLRFNLICNRISFRDLLGSGTLLDLSVGDPIEKKGLYAIVRE